MNMFKTTAITVLSKPLAIKVLENALIALQVPYCRWHSEQTTVRAVVLNIHISCVIALQVP